MRYMSPAAHPLRIDASAQATPRAKRERQHEPSANAKFHSRIEERAGDRGSVSTPAKFLNPTPTFQPWASRLPFGVDERARRRCRRPDHAGVVSVMQSHASS